MFGKKRIRELEAELALTKEKLAKSDDAIDAYIKENKKLYVKHRKLRDLELVNKCLKLSAPDGLLDEVEHMLAEQREKWLEYMTHCSNEKAEAKKLRDEAVVASRTSTIDYNDMVRAQQRNTGGMGQATSAMGSSSLGRGIY